MTSFLRITSFPIPISNGGAGLFQPRGQPYICCPYPRCRIVVMSSCHHNHFRNHARSSRLSRSNSALLWGASFVSSEEMNDEAQAPQGDKRHGLESQLEWLQVVATPAMIQCRLGLLPLLLYRRRGEECGLEWQCAGGQPRMVLNCSQSGHNSQSLQPQFWPP